MNWFETASWKCSVFRTQNFEIKGFFKKGLPIFVFSKGAVLLNQDAGVTFHQKACEMFKLKECW